ncbi:alpha/beta fold hydrolase [Alkalihalobacterium elongatum]|uniref:alpha/beta fold hydrolase n=1 Tax=Alkalihalobacterium elongatum TaxID=2675466 RepID=UPI001C1F4B0D|nr:alpha/beta hydrolase [Alkalihalobacterium elongatum]
MTKQYLVKSEIAVVDNVNVYYEYYFHEHIVEKPVILLIHGFVSSTYSFRHLIPYLAQNYSVLAIDLPGFGKSEKSNSFIYSFNNYATLIFSLITMLNIQKIIPVGHSMGGQVVLYMAKLRPELVEKVVLLSSSGYLKRAKKKYRYASYIPFAPILVKKFFMKRDYKDALSYVVYNKETVKEEDVREYAKAFEDDRFFRSLIRVLRHREGDLTAEQLKEIQHPVLLLWGKYDNVIPIHIGKRLQLDIPNTEMFIFEETGHLVPEERPQEVAGQIFQFINKDHPKS